MPWPGQWGDDWVLPRDDLVAIGRALIGWGVAWVKRRPRTVLIGGALFVLIAPLLLDLFNATPPAFRKGLGWIVFGAIVSVCLVRLAMLRQGDDPVPEGPASARGLDRVWPFLLTAICVGLAWPMLKNGNALPFGDWDLFLGKVEGARRTVLLYGQFPWWDPWTRGGFPLAANPQCGVWGIAMPFILAFGSTAGMGIGTVLCFALAAEGARRLGRLWLGDPMAAFAVGVIYAINGAVLVAAVAAYHVSMCYPALPWMLYHIFRMHRNLASGAWLGFWAAFSLLNGIQYFTVYMALIAGTVWLRAARVRTGEDRRRLLVATGLAFGVFLALSGWRLATTGVVYRDFPRPWPTGVDESLFHVLVHLLVAPKASEFLGELGKSPHFWEFNCYIGPVVVVLAVASLRWGWRWWHTLSLVCALLAVGGAQWYQPSYWLAQLPVFATMHALSRWRFMAILGVALCVGQTLSAWRQSDWPWMRTLAPIALATIAVDYIARGLEYLPAAFCLPRTEDVYPGPALPRGEFVQVRQGLGQPAIERGYGLVHGYEPLMGYDRGASTKRLWRDHPDYVAEHWTAEGPVQPVEWTPNRVVLQVEPGQEVFINQNPGSWWLINGVREHADWRVAEKDRVFSAKADRSGRLVLRIAPKGLEVGWALHLLGAVLIGVTFIGGRRR